MNKYERNIKLACELTDLMIKIFSERIKRKYKVKNKKEFIKLLRKEFSK